MGFDCQPARRYALLVRGWVSLCCKKRRRKTKRKWFERKHNYLKSFFLKWRRRPFGRKASKEYIGKMCKWNITFSLNSSPLLSLRLRKKNEMKIRAIKSICRKKKKKTMKKKKSTLLAGIKGFKSRKSFLVKGEVKFIAIYTRRKQSHQNYEWFTVDPLFYFPFSKIRGIFVKHKGK